jgi:RNase P subunit RPR2
MTSDELEDKGLMVICKHCNSANIVEMKEINMPTISSKTIEVCNNCGTVDYTQIVTEKEFENISKSEVII